MSARPALIYVSGPPGSGKTTLMAALTATATPVQSNTGDVPTIAHRRGRDIVAVELGRRRDAFSGTDALSMSIQPKAVAWLNRTEHPLLLAEGDRLANLRFLAAAEYAGRAVTLVHLDAPTALLDERCAERGSNQDPRWRAGRRTKALNLAERWAEHGGQLVRLDATYPPADLARRAAAQAPALSPLSSAEGAFS